MTIKLNFKYYSLLFILISTLFCLEISTSNNQFEKSISIEDETYSHVESSSDKEGFYSVIYKGDLLDKHSEQYARISVVPDNKTNIVTMFIDFNEVHPSRSNSAYISSLGYTENSTNAYAPVKAIKGKNKLYIGVVCSESCMFTLSFEFKKFIELTKGNPFTIQTYDEFKSYYSSFKLNSSDNQIYSISCVGGHEGDGDLHITYCKDGNRIVVDHPEHVLFNGEIGIFKAKNEEANIELNCAGNKSNIITFTVREMKSEGTKIIPNKQAYYGYLDGTIMTEECFIVDDKDYDLINEDERKYEVSVVSYTGNLKYYIKYEEESKRKYTEVKEQVAFKYSRNDISYPICFNQINEGGDATYSIQVTHYTKKETEVTPSEEPQVNAILYTHYLSWEGLKYYRHYKHRKQTTDETNFNVREEFGKVDAYIVYCTSWPNCNLDHEALEKGGKNITKLKDVNGFHTYGVKGYLDEGILSANQYLMYIYCKNDKGCKFTTSFFDEDDYFSLPVNYEIVQIMNRGQNDSYTFEVTETKYTKVIIKLHTFTGDSNLFVTKNDINLTKIEYKQYWIGNLEIFEIYPITGRSLVGRYQIKVMADEGNFYSLRYDLIDKDEYETTINLLGGYTYIEAMSSNTGKRKKYRIEDRYAETSSNFVVTIIPINCKLKVYYNNTELVTNDTYFQHFPSPFLKNEDESNYFYNYELEFESWEQSSYEGQLCTYYIASSPISKETELVLNEGHPYEFFMDFRLQEMRFLYPRPPDGKDVYADIKIEHKTAIGMQTTVENKHLGPASGVVFYRDKTVKFLSTTIDESPVEYCKKDQLCNIIIDLKMEKAGEKMRGSNIIITFKSRAKVPSMIKKRKQIEDILPNGGTNYYVFDILKNEEGEITVNFNRGSGFLLARLMNKTDVDIDPNWNGKVRLPERSDLGSEERKKKLLQTYDSFTKTLYYNSSHTKKCDFGCEMYIAVLSEDEYGRSTHTYINDYLIYLKNKIEDDQNPIIVDIPTGDFAYGALEYSLEDKSHPNYYDFYSVILMNDGDYLYVEFQSEYCELYLTYKNTTPTEKEYFQKIKSEGNGQILKIPKTEFEKEIKDFHSFENLIIRIGICAKKLDQIYTAPYKFRVYIPTDYSDEIGKVPPIIEMPTDQSVLCSITDDKEPCRFMIPKYGDDINKKIYMYASSSTYSPLEIYASKVLMRNFENMNSTTINETLPSRDHYEQTSINQTDGSYLSFLFGDTSNDDFILVSIYCNQSTMINFMSSFRAGLTKTIINPSTWQIFTLENENLFKLILPIEHTFVINIVSITGEASITYGERRQRVQGPGDSFSSTVLYNISNSSNNEVEIKTDTSYFNFYTYIQVRSNKENFDETRFGVSTEFYFPQSDFPLMFFCKIGNDKNIIMNFHVWNAIKSIDSKVTTAEALEIEATVDSIDKVYERKNDNKVELRQFTIKGKYDDISNSGMIYISPTDIPTDIISPYAIVRIKKADRNKIIYSRLSLEVLFSPLSDINYPIPVNLYYNSFIPVNKSSVTLCLRKSFSDYGTMLLEFSANTNKVHIEVSENYSLFKEQYKNTSMKEISSNTGKAFFSISKISEYNQMYLTVYFDSGTVGEKDVSKTGFTFRYVSKRGMKPKAYSIPSSPISIASRNPMKISVKTIKGGSYPIHAMYYIALIDNRELKKKGYYSQSMALMDLTLNHVVHEVEVYRDSGSSFNVKLSGYNKKQTYYRVFVLCVISENGERLVYPLFNQTKKNVVGIVLGSVFGVISAAVILYLIYYFCKKKQKQNVNLQNLVESTSFARASIVNNDYLTGKEQLEEIAI